MTTSLRQVVGSCAKKTCKSRVDGLALNFRRRVLDSSTVSVPSAGRAKRSAILEDVLVPTGSLSPSPGNTLCFSEVDARGISAGQL
jgi:hypothetical protein